MQRRSGSKKPKGLLFKRVGGKTTAHKVDVKGGRVTPDPPPPLGDGDRKRGGSKKR